MPGHIKKFNREEEFYFKEGCYIVETSNSAADADVSICQAKVKVGKSTKWHWLNETFERYVIIEGAGRVEIGAEEPCDVGPGDVVLIPPQTRQRISNIGDNDLIFLAICSPRFSHRNYRNIK